MIIENIIGVHNGRVTNTNNTYVGFDIILKNDLKNDNNLLPKELMDIIVKYNTTCLMSVYISDNQSCCEDFGTNICYNNESVSVYDDEQKFKKIKDLINKKTINKIYMVDGCEIHFEFTDKTKLKCCVFNHHNGYYPHSVFIKWVDYNCVSKVDYASDEQITKDSKDMYEYFGSL